MEQLQALVARIAAERHRLEAVLHALDDAVIAVDSDGALQLANPQARALWDLDSAALGAPLLDRVRLPAMHEIVGAALSGRSAEIDAEMPGPPRRRLHLRGTPQREGGAVVIVSDVTRLDRLERIRRDFVANVSHELRTPVSVIQLSADALANGGMEDRQQAEEFVDAITRNAERLAGLVADLLDLSRIESGRQVLQRTPLPLAAHVSAVLRGLAPAAAVAGVAIAVQALDDLTVHADARALEQVLVNLLDNALRVSAPGQRVVVRALLSGEWVRIEVLDQGPGVPFELRERLFERFFRRDRGRGEAGTGLGLAIARHLVGAMGGAIGVGAVAELPDGGGADWGQRGAVFWLTLPRHQSALAASLGESPASAAPPRLPSQPSTPTSEAAILALRPEVQDLRRLLLRMAGKVEEMIATAVRAVVLRDQQLALQTIAADHAVNRDELAVDGLCLSLLAAGVAAGVELRFVSRSLKMVTDMERIADLTVNICERVPRLVGARYLGEDATMERMAEIVQGMVRDVMDAFVAGDVAAARAVIARDDEVDHLYHDLSRRLLVQMATDTRAVEAGMDLQAVAKFLERIGDHATNLGEQVIFMMRGDEVRHMRSRSVADRP